MPEDPKVRERLQEFKEEKGEESRIRESSERYEQTEAAIKMWCS